MPPLVRKLRKLVFTVATEEGLFVAVDVLARRTGMSEDKCYEALKMAIYYDAALGETFPPDSIRQESPSIDITYSDNLQKLTAAVVFASSSS